MTSENKTEYKKPERIPFIFMITLVVFISILMTALIIVPSFVVQLTGGETVNLETGESGKIYNLEGDSKTVSVQTLIIESPVVEVKKYYTNDLYLDDGAGKAGISVSNVKSEKILVDNSNLVELKNPQNKNTAILITELKDYKISVTNPFLIIFIIPGLLLILLSFIWLGHILYYRLTN